MDALLQDLRYAVRGLRTSVPGSTLCLLAHRSDNQVIPNYD